MNISLKILCCNSVSRCVYHSHLISIKLSSTLSEKSVSIQRFYPEAPLPNSDEIGQLNEFIERCQRLLVISGAGLSTESGIPDYRSKDVGLYDRTNHKPITHHEFMTSSQGRRRYWARNFLGWEKFQNHEPNVAHEKLSYLEQAGKVHWHITQNVDGLHSKAGSKLLTELHGCMHRVICLNCGSKFSRTALQEKFKILNIDWGAKATGIGPDADVFVETEDIQTFQVPKCENCNGILKPDVVFFGDSVPLEVVAFLNDKVEQSDGILVVGSSLYVWSGYKFVLRAFNNSIPIAAINVGRTRADAYISLKINALCTKVLSQVTC